ncbi:MAG: S1 RNA-binding domain-containing protein, partial [Lachnospiraceae bacterium]|nr:S1 RNA-binding domain-containing protein [Lachnospiraceae bacterium]
MLQLGEFQTLTVIKKVEFGVYLAEEAGSEDRVLLPKKQVPQGTRLGDAINVFLYRDSDDRMIATCEEPKLVMGEYGL